MKSRLIAPLLFGVFLLIVPHLVQAQDFVPRCDGVDLRSTLSADEFEQINTAAASVPNARGRLWKIEKEGVAPSWLIGTMHIADERVRQLSSAENAAFHKARRVALELEEILESPTTNFLKLLHEHRDTFFYTESDVIKNALPAPQFALFEEALEKRGLSYALLSHTKPWLIWATLSMPSCVVAQEAEGGVPFDANLGRLADLHLKDVIGLEEPHEQLQAIDSLPLDFYITSLIQVGALSDRLDDYHETMIALYLDGEIGAIMPTLQALMVRDLEERGLGDAEMPSSADMLRFETILLDERNAVMAERAVPLLEQGQTLIAVGALHLVGETGLVEQFRRMGYQVTRGQ